MELLRPRTRDPQLRLPDFGADQRQRLPHKHSTEDSARGTDVAGCSAQFSQFSNLITGKVHDWKGGSPARQDSLDLLQAFQQALQAKLNNVNAVKSSLAGFQTKLNVDVSNFNTASSR
jgi:hypothetical protein